MEYIILDSGYWFALYNSRDQYHNDAKEINNFIDSFNNVSYIIPFPSLYEVLNSRFIKNKIIINQIETLIKAKKAILLHDEDYRDRAISYIFSMHTEAVMKVSLVDAIIREILSDQNINISYLITFNAKDFQDICNKRKIVILDNN